MKVSKEKRDEIRRSLIEAAVALFVEKGLSETSMREIAARANVSPGTAYKYFPDREQLLSAFFEIKLVDAEASLLTIEDFGTFNFKEKLQSLLEALLQEYLADREFVAIAIKNIVDAPLHSLGAMQPIRHKLTAIVDSFITDAVAAGEFETPLHQSFLSNVFWDYTTLVILYWLKDTSEAFVKTSEFIDKSLDIYVSLVRSGLVDQVVRLGTFLLKSHLYGNFEHFATLFGAITDFTTGRPAQK